MALKESENERGKARKKQEHQQFRAYQALSERVEALLQRFPQDKALIGISEIMSARIKELRDSLRWVSYTARDGYSWFMRRGAKPAIGPRLLLAVCIARELWPERSPYQVVVEQIGHTQDENADVVNNHIRAVEKQVFRVLRHPEKYPAFGADRSTDPYVLLRNELFDFKAWKARQNERADMPIEEFDQQFDDYLKRIHPTAEEEQLLRTLLENFVQGSRSWSRQAKRNQLVCATPNNRN